MPDAGDVARMKRIAARIQARGVRVKWVAGWDKRGGTFPVVPNASFIHHDASNSRSGTWGALGIITNGRGGERPVPGPLSQFQGARGNISEVAIVAAGIANHAGTGGPLKGLPQNNANRETYGMEVANNGVGEKYSSATLYTIQVVQASIAEECKFSEYYVIGHKEWSNRKIDPTYSMNWMRDLIAKVMAGTIEEDELSAEDVKKINDHTSDLFYGKRVKYTLPGEKHLDGNGKPILYERNVIQTEANTRIVVERNYVLLKAVLGRVAALAEKLEAGDKAELMKIAEVLNEIDELGERLDEHAVAEQAQDHDHSHPEGV